MDEKGEDSVDAEKLLSRVNLFRSLNQKQIAQLARSATMQTYQPGQVIVAQGESGRGLYVLASGRAEVRKESRAQESVALNLLGPGQVFGEMALLDDAQRSASVVAQETSQCLVLAKQDFLAALEVHPEIAVPVLRIISRRLRDTLELLGAQG
jgi:CRP-like cAMP-binding protein